MPQNAFFPRTRDLLVSQKMMQRHFFPILHHLSTVFFAIATVLAFVLLRNSRFNFHCCTQCEATPTQKSAWKWSCNFFHERLQRAFTCANQFHWTAQYLWKISLLQNHASLELICFLQAPKTLRWPDVVDRMLKSKGGNLHQLLRMTTRVIYFTP